MDYLATNLALLSGRQPELAAELRSLAAGTVEVFRSASGIPSARINQGSSVVAIHSRYDPMKEARQAVAKADLADADHFVLLGFGLGYMLDALLEKTSGPANAFFVVEPDLQLLRAAFSARDLRGILSLPRLHFAWPAVGLELAKQWKGFLDPVRARKNAYIQHAPSVALSPELFRSAAEIIQSETFQIFTDINTLVGRSEVFLDNFVRNLPHALVSPGVRTVAGKFRRIPAVLVSAGPSLDKNVHELRNHGDGVLILATDTTLKPLLAAGIEPHFVLTGDPSLANFLHLEGAPTREALLVAEATSHPGSFEQFMGRTIVCSFENSSLRAIAEILNYKGQLRAWGSVATMALDYALLLGCDPIIFIGQDLAHSDGRTYCSGLHFQREWFPGGVTPESWREKWKEVRSKQKTVAMEDIFGRPVETTDRLAAYWNWITKEIAGHKGTHFVNATEGGILRDGVEVMSLREALFRYGSEDRGLRARVRTLYDAGRRQSPAPDGRAARRLLAEAEAIRSLLSPAPSPPLPESSAKLLDALERQKESIYQQAPGLASIVDCFNQLGNVHFLRSRAELTATGSLPHCADIHKVYREYFDTVLAALDKVAPALNQIENILDRTRSDSSVK